MPGQKSLRDVVDDVSRGVRDAEAKGSEWLGKARDYVGGMIPQGVKDEWETSMGYRNRKVEKEPVGNRSAAGPRPRSRPQGRSNSR